MSKLAISGAAVALFAAVFGAVPPASAAQFKPTQFIVFGDSFVDAGAVNRATEGQFAPRELGFWEGRFSDGPTWIDYLGYANFGRPTQAFNNGAPLVPPPFVAGYTNFAIGGARASGDDVRPEGTIPGLLSQVGLYAQYRNQTGLGFDPGALYVLNFGNNDVQYIRALKAEAEQALANGNPVLAAQIGQQIAQTSAAYVTNMVAVAGGLAAAGADYILIGGVPNPTQAEGQQLQAALLQALAGLQPQFDAFNANVSVFDYFSFFGALQQDPVSFGLPATLNFNTPCLVAEVPSFNIDCGNYLSFDGIHVTTGVQRAISIQVANQLGIQAVPEPATWAMLIAGFGLIGYSMRRRRRVESAGG